MNILEKRKKRSVSPKLFILPQNVQLFKKYMREPFYSNLSETEYYH